MAANRTSFKKGNPGRPKGAKNRVPPIEVRLRIVGELGPRMFEVLKEALYSPHKCDRQWGAERVLSLLPREDAMKIEGKIESLHPLAQRFLNGENPRVG